MEIGGQVWILNEKSKAKNGISKCQLSRLFRFFLIGNDTKIY